MSIALLPFSTGQNVRVLILPLIKANDSFLLTSAGTSYSFAGRVETVGESVTLHDTDLTPMDLSLDNPVTMGYTGEYTVTEFESPAAYGGTFASVPVNVLRTCLATSYYAALVVQTGVLLNGAWTPKSQDKAVVKFTTTGRNTGRDSSKRSASFTLVPYVDAASGTFGVNPIIGDNSFSSPFGFVTGS